MILLNVIWWRKDGCRILTVYSNAQNSMSPSMFSLLCPWNSVLILSFRPYNHGMPQFCWLYPWFVPCVPNTKTELSKRKIKNYRLGQTSSVTFLHQTCYLMVPRLGFPIHKMERWKEKKSVFKWSDWSRTGVKTFLTCGIESPTSISIHTASAWIQGLAWELGFSVGVGKRAHWDWQITGRSVCLLRESFSFSSSGKNLGRLTRLDNRVWMKVSWRGVVVVTVLTCPSQGTLLTCVPLGRKSALID